jgi:hypothetical protein
MALTVTSRGTGTDNTGATTLVPGGRSGTMAANSLGVLCMALDNAGASGSTLIAPDSWTDAKSNVWTLRANALFDNGAASAGIEMAIYTAPIVTQLLTTDAGTMTWKTGVSPVAKAWTWYEVIPSNGIAPAFLDKATIAGATAANASVGTTVNVNVGDATIAGYFSENVAAVTGDSDGTNGNWVGAAGTNGSIDTATVGTTTSGVRIATAKKVQTTAASAQTWDCTVSSQDRIAGLIMVREVVTQTVQPAAATATIGMATPTVVAGANVLVQPAAAAITVGTATPAVVTNVLVQPAAAAVTTAGATPAVGTPVSIAPAAAAVAIGTATPALVAQNWPKALPAAAEVAVGTATPTVVAQDWPKVEPAAAAITVGTATPAVALPVSVAPDAAGMSAAGATPAVWLPVSLAPGAVAVGITSATPAVATWVLVQPSAAEVAITTATPAVSAVATTLVQPGAAEVTIGTAAPSVTTTDHRVLQMAAAALMFAGMVPDVAATANVMVVPGPLGLTLTGYPPIVTVTGDLPTPSVGSRRRAPLQTIDALADDEEVLIMLYA